MRYGWLDGYLMEKQGVSRDFKEEWQWTRYLLGEKMFAAVCRDEAGKDALITLKLEPAYGDYLRRQYEDITPGYYMNKVHWNSIAADGEVPDELLKELLDQSYRLVLSGLSKKKQKELTDKVFKIDQTKKQLPLVPDVEIQSAAALPVPPECSKLGKENG